MLPSRGLSDAAMKHELDRKNPGLINIGCRLPDVNLKLRDYTGGGCWSFKDGLLNLLRKALSVCAGDATITLGCELGLLVSSCLLTVLKFKHGLAESMAWLKLLKLSLETQVMSTSQMLWGMLVATGRFARRSSTNVS